MKTWTNPTVEELEVKMTANGWMPNEYETIKDAIEGETGVEIPGGNIDIPYWKEKTQS